MMPSVMAKLASLEDLKWQKVRMFLPVCVLVDMVPSMLARACPAAARPDLSDHCEQKGGGKTEQQHPVERFERTHHLPLRFKKNVRVAIGRHCAERIEHGGFIIG